MKEHKPIMYIMALGFLVVALAIMFAPRQPINVNTTGDSQNVISVSGEAELSVDPDTADVYIRVKTEEPTAKRAQEENARLMNTVQEALLEAGVKKSEMQTTNYNLWPQQKWNRETNEYTETGFIAQHVLKVTTNDVTEVGTLLDIAVRNGANGLDRVEFRISDEQQEDVDSEALAQAASNAEDKAKSLAQNLGVRLGNVARVSESNVGYDYITPRYAMAESADAGGMAKTMSTEISPETVKVRATVSIAYEI